VETRCNCEDSFNISHNFSISITAVGETGASGKMVSKAMVRGTRRTDRSGLIGQGLHYSSMTKKKAGIVLILENKKDRKYWIRLNTTIEHFNLPIETWNVGNAAY
jgi:hypothetical protein